MWETQLCIVDWSCFKTRILLETLKTLNQRRVEFCVVLGVECAF